MRSPSRNARFATLRAVPWLADCSDEDINSLVSSSDEIDLPAGAIVAREGHYCTEFVVVMDGKLCAKSGTARSQLGQGDSLGWDSMWDRSINHATVVAESDVRLLVVGHAQFRAFKAVAGNQPMAFWSGPTSVPGWEQAAS
jgi:CRP-like cAMP-binding protein